MPYQFPAPAALVDALRVAKDRWYRRHDAWALWCGAAAVPAHAIRLQVTHQGWAVWCGPASGDIDLAGVWGSGWLTTPIEILAAELLNAARDAAMAEAIRLASAPASARVAHQAP